MSFESLMSTTHHLSASMDALAAMGAELRLRRQGKCGTKIHSLLFDLLQQIDPTVFDEITAEQEQAALAVIDSLFRQAVDLLESPSRPFGWSYSDPDILNGQGLTSRRFVREFVRLSAARPELAERMRRPGVLLDVGTGAAWLAIEAARVWAEWRVVGIDEWKPALNLARDNVASSGVGNRIELRAQAVENLDDENIFTLAWLPGAFLPAQAIDRSLSRVVRALVPGGWIVFGLSSPPPGPAGEALNRLKVVRNGGYPWTPSEVERRLATAGFVQVESIPAARTTLVVGQREPQPGPP